MCLALGVSSSSRSDGSRTPNLVILVVVISRLSGSASMSADRAANRSLLPVDSIKTHVRACPMSGADILDSGSDGNL